MLNFVHQFIVYFLGSAKKSENYSYICSEQNA